jgi:hypothetical protein
MALVLIARLEKAQTDPGAAEFMTVTELEKAPVEGNAFCHDGEAKPLPGSLLIRAQAALGEERLLSHGKARAVVFHGEAHGGAF